MMTTSQSLALLLLTTGGPLQSFRVLGQGNLAGLLSFVPEGCQGGPVDAAVSCFTAPSNAACIGACLLTAPLPSEFPTEGQEDCDIAGDALCHLKGCCPACAAPLDNVAECAEAELGGSDACDLVACGDGAGTLPDLPELLGCEGAWGAVAQCFGENVFMCRSCVEGLWPEDGAGAPAESEECEIVERAVCALADCCSPCADQTRGFRECVDYTDVPEGEKRCELACSGGYSDNGGCTLGATSAISALSAGLSWIFA